MKNQYSNSLFFLRDALDFAKEEAIEKEFFSLQGKLKRSDYFFGAGCFSVNEYRLLVCESILNLDIYKKHRVEYLVEFANLVWDKGGHSLAFSLHEYALMVYQEKLNKDMRKRFNSKELIELRNLYHQLPKYPTDYFHT